MSRTVRLGLFIIATFAILVVGIFIIGGKSYLFTPTYTLHTQFPDVAGLTGGADVLVGGVHSGTVKSIDLPDKPGGQVGVVLQMDSKTKKILKKDSIASIQTQGLLGNQFIAISFGTDGNGDLKDGDTIGSVPPLQMAAIMDKAQAMLATGQQAMNNIVQVTANLNSITAKVNSGQGTVGALVNDRSLYDNLSQTAATTKQTVAEAQLGVVSFQENMEALKHNFLLRGYFKNRGYDDSSDLEKDAIDDLPNATPLKDFTIDGKKIFDKVDSAKLKNQKQLAPAGEFLAGNDFGLAVVAVSTGSTGDSDNDQVLAEGRAMVVRQYLVDHYGFDDSKLKTVAIGKDTDDQGEDKGKQSWGSVRIVVYPTGTSAPAGKQAPAKAAPTAPKAGLKKTAPAVTSNN